MWNELLQGGLSLGGIAFAIKILWPLLSKRLEADEARASTDATLHNLYQETLKEMRQLSMDLSNARYEIAKLKSEVEQLTSDLIEARKELEKRNETRIH